MSKHTSDIGSFTGCSLCCHFETRIWKGMIKRVYIAMWRNGCQGGWILGSERSSSFENKLKPTLVEWSQEGAHIANGRWPVLLPTCHWFLLSCNWTVWQGASYPITRPVHTQQCVNSQGERPDWRRAPVATRTPSGALVEGWRSSNST